MSRFVLVWGSLNFDPTSLRGTLDDSCLKRESSLWRIGRFSYSAAEARISISPRNLVLLLRDMLKSSAGDVKEVYIIIITVDS